MLGHQVGDDDAGGAGQAHVAVDHDQAASSDRAVDKLRGAVEISEEVVLRCLAWLVLADTSITLKCCSEVDHPRESRSTVYCARLAWPGSP